MLGALLPLALLALPQNSLHPGLVHVGDGQWVPPAEALERGMIEYRGRWVEKKLEKDLRKWEKEDAKGLEWEDAYKTKSKYYRIETNVPRYIVELEIKPYLDELFETYVRVFKEDFGLAGKAAGNKDIRIHHGFDSYSIHEGEPGKPRPRTNPGFIISGAILVVYYEETDPGTFYMTVFHEGSHQFFLSLLPGATPPHWMTEALATYFEGCTYSRATRTITPGFVPPERLKQAQAVLTRRPQATAAELFMDVPREDFGGLEYSLAWSFVHYLIHRPGEESRARFGAFVRELNGSGARPAPEVFARATGEDLEALIPGWRAHVLALPVPEEIKWVVLKVAKNAPEEDLRSKDLLWSFDGVEVFSAKQYVQLWKNRPTDRPYEVVVVRGEPDFHSEGATRRFVRQTIQPGSTISIHAMGEAERRGGLVD